MQTVRGKAYNLERYKQVVDFSGLLFERGITPTDIDGFLDFAGKLFVFLEFKQGNAPVLYGQRLALERLCDGMVKPHVLSVALIARHYTTPSQEIDAAKSIVSEFRWLGKWRKPKYTITVRQAINKIKSIPM